MAPAAVVAAVVVVVAVLLPLVPLLLVALAAVSAVAAVAVGPPVGPHVVHPTCACVFGDDTILNGLIGLVVALGVSVDEWNGVPLW